MRWKHAPVAPFSSFTRSLLIGPETTTCGDSFLIIGLENNNQHLCNKLQTTAFVTQLRTQLGTHRRYLGADQMMQVHAGPRPFAIRRLQSTDWQVASPT